MCGAGNFPVRFLSTPSARRATRRRRGHGRREDISIHALREEGDHRSPQRPQRRRISIHALREEGDFGVLCGRVGVKISIHALREEGDRPARTLGAHTFGFLSTPSARRATFGLCLCKLSSSISIHALREEGDQAKALNIPVISISIHALREEGDRPFSQFVMTLGYFYPRPPRGGRQPNKTQL